MNAAKWHSLNFMRLNLQSETSLSQGDMTKILSLGSLMTRFWFDISIILKLFPLAWRGWTKQTVEWSFIYMESSHFNQLVISSSNSNSFNSFNGLILFNILTFLSYTRISYIPHQIILEISVTIKLSLISIAALSAS